MLAQINDEFMKAELSRTKLYSLVVPKKTEKFVRPAADAVIWEHGRRNLASARLKSIECYAPRLMNESGNHQLEGER